MGADMMNTGINSPGAISAGCFLSRFADGTPWAHLDVQEPLLPTPNRYRQPAALFLCCYLT